MSTLSDRVCDEIAALKREFIAAQERMSKLVSRMERAGVLRSVA